MCDMQDKIILLNYTIWYIYIYVLLHWCPDVYIEGQENTLLLIIIDSITT